METTPHHGKLHHKTPGWVPEGERFHIRIRTERGGAVLTQPDLAARLLESARLYHTGRRWYVWLFLLMPNHIHAVLSFPLGECMSKTVGLWKRYQGRVSGVDWQEGFFDHRLRNDEEFTEKAHYIRMNPVRQGLCSSPELWPWIIEPWRDDARRQ
jgi:REP element-mobilizing transposase RayT